MLPAGFFTLSLFSYLFTHLMWVTQRCFIFLNSLIIFIIRTNLNIPFRPLLLSIFFLSKQCVWPRSECGLTHSAHRCSLYCFLHLIRYFLLKWPYFFQHSFQIYESFLNLRAVDGLSFEFFEHEEHQIDIVRKEQIILGFEESVSAFGVEPTNFLA